MVQKVIELKCDFCGNKFEKKLGEHRRSLKVGRILKFCGLVCSCKHHNKVRPQPGNINNLDSGNLKDEFTPFRYYLRKAKARDKNKNRIKKMNLSLDSLKKLWEKQEGKCYFTGEKLVLPENCEGWKNITPYAASLDRIDNSIGYTQENVRYISYMANIARRTFSDNEVINFCKKVASIH